jgi:hypothetical protein
VAIRLHPPVSTGVTTRLHPAVICTELYEEVARLLAAIREGMPVRSADGKRLGKVLRVYVREPEFYLFVASEADRWNPVKQSFGLYLPASAIGEVDTKQVRLSIDAQEAKGCTWCPSWIPPYRVNVPDKGLTVAEAQRLRELEKENARLKRLLAERDLEVDALKELLAKKGLPCSTIERGEVHCCCRPNTLLSCHAYWYWSITETTSPTRRWPALLRQAPPARPAPQ